VWAAKVFAIKKRLEQALAFEEGFVDGFVAMRAAQGFE